VIGKKYRFLIKFDKIYIQNNIVSTQNNILRYRLRIISALLPENPFPLPNRLPFFTKHPENPYFSATIIISSILTINQVFSILTIKGLCRILTIKIPLDTDYNTMKTAFSLYSPRTPIHSVTHHACP